MWKNVAGMKWFRIRTVTRAEVIRNIGRFLNPSADCGPYEWDDFISVPIKHDSELEAIRDFCGQLPDLYPVPKGERGYCNTEGIAELRRILEDLKKNEREDT